MRRGWRKAACLLLTAVLGIGSLAGCHGSRERNEFVVPENFDTSKEMEITFWAKNDTNKLQTAVYEQAIADFEEDSDLETVTVPEASVSAVGFNWWTEEVVNFAGTSSYDTHALRLRWKEDASYILRIQRTDVTGQSVCFDICDMDEHGF